MNTIQFFDFFRFKDPRTSFSGSPFTAPGSTIPFPAPGFGVAFELRPVKGSEFYISGIVSDVNAQIERYSWNEFFKKGAYFYGLEFGYFWRRSPDDFDHVHLDLFYAAAPEVSPFAPVFQVGNDSFGRLETVMGCRGTCVHLTRLLYAAEVQSAETSHDRDQLENGDDA